MVIAVLQFEMLIPGASSIKDKRRVVSSIKDRLHREHQVSVAEVGLQDCMSAARMGLALVASDGKYAGQVLDRIAAKLRAWPDAELGDCSREVLHDPQSPEASAPNSATFTDATLHAEMIDRACSPEEAA